MAFIQWRRFNFFNKQIVDPGSVGRTWTHIRDRHFLCSTSGRGYLVFGDSEGVIHMVNHCFQVSTSFKAFELAVNHLFLLKQHNMLAAVGIDETGINPVIKVWNLDKKDKLGNPFCCRVQATIPSDNVPSEVTEFCVHESLTMMAAGFAQGSVVLYKGDIAKDRISNKTIHIITDTTDSITGLSFHGTAKDTTLFVSTEKMVFNYNLQDKPPKKFVLDQQNGCPLRCSSMTDVTLDNQFIATATSAVYFYGTDSVGACYAFDGEKVMAKWCNGYLILVYKDKAKSSIPTTSTMRLLDKNVVTIYDMSQKLIAYSAPLPGVQDVLYEWGTVFVLSADNTLTSLQEIDIHHKLEMLFKKNLYSMAVNIAKNQNLSEEGMVDIFTLYGDHLYSKGDFDTAIAQYMKTIGHLEPSYIIRKFLDAQQIHNLASYLQALHEKGLANEDHTTLLLNCFTKLKDEDNLNKFIMTPSAKLHFDVETAIKVCRQAGYYQHALQLAEKQQKHKWYLKILLEDTHKHGKALSYIKKLPLKEVEEAVKQYGKVLMSNVPEETTQLLIRLCTENSPVTSSGEEEDVRPAKSNGEEFIHIFVNSSGMLVTFLEQLVKGQKEPSVTVYNTLLELYLHTMNQTETTKAKKELEEKTMKLLKDSSKKFADQALVLCQMHNFRPGILHLYEAQELYQQILRYHIDNKAHGMIVETCRRHGDKDVTLWQQALTYFAQQRDSDCRQHIAQVLSHIEKHNLLPPLMVIQILARNANTTLATVKDYILRRIRQESEEIKKYEQSIEEYKEETAKMKEEIDNFKTSATIFQETKCYVCSHALELPAVHFLCKHAYHQHCFESYADNENECPSCADKNRKVQEQLKEQEQILSDSMTLHEQFKSQLKRSNDGFSVVADYFSKGVFNKVTLLGDDEITSSSSGAPQSGGMSSHRIDPGLQKELLMMQQSNRR